MGNPRLRLACAGIKRKRDRTVSSIASRFHFLRRKKGLILLTIFIAGVGTYAVPHLHAALFAFVYPLDKDILVNRSIEPGRFFTVRSGGVITVTVAITNSEDVALRGFYYSDQMPNEWLVHTTGVSVNGSPITDYVYSQGYADQIYAGSTPHRWALEMPQGDHVFSPVHPIAALTGTAQITYTMIVSGGTGSDYTIGHEAWAGWLETVSTGTAVFGYLGITKTMNADFTASPRGGTVPFTVHFADTSSGEPTAWLWDFGDGSVVSYQQHPTHTYATSGTYTVILTATRAQPTHSDTVVKFDFITVTFPPLQANFSAHPILGLPPLTVELTDLSVGNILTRTWDFGDRITTSVPNPTHTFSTLGHYTVSLTVQDIHREHSLVRPRYIHVTDEIYNAHLPTILRN